MAAALQVFELVKDYPVARSLRELLRSPFRRKLRRALDGFSLTVAAGERLALVGPNGAGKTTLARIATGVVLPDAGGAQVAGADVTRGSAWHAAVGFARPDDPSLHGRLDPLECLRFHAALYGVRTDAAGLTSALRRVEAEELATRRIQTLSSGERARVSLAKALLHGPRLLILDELSRVLDPGAAARTRALLSEFAAKGGAVLLITHDMTEAALCDRVAVVEKGRIVDQGPWSAVEAKAKEVFRL